MRAVKYIPVEEFVKKVFTETYPEVTFDVYVNVYPAHDRSGIIYSNGKLKAIVVNRHMIAIDTFDELVCLLSEACAACHGFTLPKKVVEKWYKEYLAIIDRHTEEYLRLKNDTAHIFVPLKENKLKN